MKVQVGNISGFKAGDLVFTKELVTKLRGGGRLQAGTEAKLAKVENKMNVEVWTMWVRGPERLERWKVLHTQIERVVYQEAAGA
jgi:hypothetical protein